MSNEQGRRFLVDDTNPDLCNAVEALWEKNKKSRNTFFYMDFAEDLLNMMVEIGSITPTMESSDKERLLYVARVLREIADLKRDKPLGDLYPEAVMSLGTIKRVLNMNDADFIAQGIVSKNT